MSPDSVSSCPGFHLRPTSDTSPEVGVYPLGLLNAFLGVAGELLPSVEESLLSIFKEGQQCNYSWVFALIAGPTYLIVGVVVLPCYQPPPIVRL